MSKPKTPEPLVEPTREDREALSSVQRLYHDEDKARVIARNRIASTAALREENAKLRAILGGIVASKGAVLHLGSCACSLCHTLGTHLAAATAATKETVR